MPTNGAGRRPARRRHGGSSSSSTRRALSLLLPLLCGLCTLSGAAAASNGRIAFATNTTGPYAVRAHTRAQRRGGPAAAQSAQSARCASSGTPGECSSGHRQRAFWAPSHSALHPAPAHPPGSLPPPHPQIWAVNPDGSCPRQLTSPAGGVEFAAHPAFSPDGAALAFTCRDASGDYNICVAAADGTGLRRVTNYTSPHYAMVPAFTANGSALVYESNAHVAPANSTASDPTEVGVLRRGGRRWARALGERSTSRCALCTARCAGALPRCTRVAHQPLPRAPLIA